MMILQDSNNENEQVIQELSDKIFVETLFLRDLDKFFKKVLAFIESELRAHEKQFATIQTKQANLVMEFEQDLDKLLTANYRRGMYQAIKRFKDDELINQLFTKPEIRRVIDESMSNIDAYIVRRNTFVSPEILNTTANNLEQAKTFIDKQIAANDLALSTAEKNSLIMENLTLRVENRKETIATTETQNIYQSSKQTLGVHVANKLSRTGKALQKRWNATLDQKTRRDHAMAHGQLVPFESMYTVGGESLMYPGDTSHGASLKNIVNCRCESIQTIIAG